MNDTPTPAPLDVTLKPCPFCGGEAMRLTLTENDGLGNAGGDVICCIRCEASSHVEFGRKENLVDRWNTRASASQTPPAAPDGVVEALYQRLRDGDDAKDGWTDAGMEDAFFRWCIIERELRAIVSAPTTPSVSGEAILDVLATARDYFTDAAKGTLTYEGSDEGFKLMAAEDLARLEAVFTSLTTPPTAQAAAGDEQPIYAGLTARELAMGTYHPGDDA